MRKKLFTLLLVVAASVGTMFAEKVQIGDLYYNLDATNQTAEVTYQNQYGSNNYSGLTAANIPASVVYNEVVYSVTSIGSSAFSYSGLTSVSIPNSVTSIGSSAFSYSDLTSVTIPNSVTSIGENAFMSCTGLTSVTIPNSVTNIGKYAFSECSGLTSPVYNTHVFAYMPTSYSGAYTIPDGIESIAGGALYGCTGLTSITIPNSVTSIGYAAFYNCSGLTSVTIPNSVTSIGDYAFDGCSSLTSVTIGNSVTSIGEGAFWGCSGLTSITCEALNPPTLGSSIFYEVNKSIPLYVPAESITAYKTADQWKDFLNILPSPQGMEEIVENSSQEGKFIHNGHIFILRGEKVYNAQGALVK